jgi:signal transduction histidine kinase
VVVKVTDNGIGIPLEYQEKIFNMFQRLHSEEEYPGTGIGLAAVRKSVELLGGSVWVESKPGDGSTFFVRLPKE